MTFFRHLMWGSCATTMVLGVAATPVFAQGRPAPRPPSSALIDATHPILQADDMAAKGDTPVFGDVSKPGMYVLRKRMAANQIARPHYDGQDRLITVLTGTLWVGRGDVYRPDLLVPIREGGVVYLPANTHYFEMAGDAETIVQITGNGPVKSVHSEVDEKGQPVPEHGPYPALGSARRRNMPVDPDLLTPDQIDQMERAAAARKAAESAKKKAAGQK
jgi:hypothetical protein